jgi:monoamine oxidase
VKLRRQAVLDSLGCYFGPRAVQADDFLELDGQQERWTGGCYGTLSGPDVWTRYGPALREPVGPIRWAGTETASAWAGYIWTARSAQESRLQPRYSGC